MSTAPVVLHLSANATQALRQLRVVREAWCRSMIPGYRWRDPYTGRFVRIEQRVYA